MRETAYVFVRTVSVCACVRACVRACVCVCVAGAGSGDSSRTFDGTSTRRRSTSEGEVPVCDRTKYVCLKNMFVRKREKYTWGGGGGGGVRLWERYGEEKWGGGGVGDGGGGLKSFCRST